MTEQKQRVIVITGGGSGMGEAMAEAFVREEGAAVAILGRNGERLGQVAKSLGPNVFDYQVDVSQRQQVEAAVEAIVGRYDRIDVLINAAGFSGNGVKTDMSLVEAERDWDHVQETNLKGSFLMTMAVAPHLSRPGGRIIFISSIAAYTGGSRAGSVVYAATKAGVHGLTYGFARELSEQGITVNAIAPGFIADTGFTGDWSDERVQGIVSQVPVGRAGQVDDVSGAALYLASPRASFVTGQILNVNGGWRFGS
ncbi:SDR family NAD(P)-dependent oxidoreductase [Dictyobacter aurantiacus]|uniref:Short-chain dehydrogenase n=1 Tax=Dictyobacter aurantiacus TaxID=1936993 RepID=A0A401ZFK5_9CHLR|nr:SDR family oxidoreductase [Dictyobacter aurantiacus]GCE05671.1 short-chain dehydrogenase [Dictyobacter aurantiacus]